MDQPPVSPPHPPSPRGGRGRSPQGIPLPPVTLWCWGGSLLLLGLWLGSVGDSWGRSQPTPPQASQSLPQSRNAWVSSTLKLGKPAVPLAPSMAGEDAADANRPPPATPAIQGVIPLGQGSPQDWTGVPEPIQRELQDRGAKEPPLVAFAQLYQAHDRFQKTLGATLGSPGADPGEGEEAGTAPQNALAALDRRIQQETLAHDRWNQARLAAMAAVAQGEAPQPSLQTWETAAAYWQTALDWLDQVPRDSLWGQWADDRQGLYRYHLATAHYEASQLQPSFLPALVQRYRLGSRTHISLCPLEGRCHHYQGDAPILRPASLAKIPIAVALIQRLQTQGISLDTAIPVQRGNFTEDMGKITVGRSYTLGELLTDMLANSGNVSANQLIDYVGWPSLGQTLQRRGYRNTRLSFKFVGAYAMPSGPGTQANVLTSQDLTDMVRFLYQEAYPGKDQVLAALGHQVDRDLGYGALQKTSARWLGEKTGRTSQTTGTVMAFEVGDRVYILSLVDQSGLSDGRIQEIVGQVVGAIVADPDLI